MSCPSLNERSANQFFQVQRLLEAGAVFLRKIGINLENFRIIVVSVASGAAYISCLEFSFKHRGYRTCWKRICVIARLEPRRSLLHRVFLCDSPTSFFKGHKTRYTTSFFFFFIYILFFSSSLFLSRSTKFTASMNNRAGVLWMCFVCLFLQGSLSDLLFEPYRSNWIFIFTRD